MILVPVQQNISAWSQRVSFDGVDYQLDFAWNGRSNAWFISLLDIAGNPLVLSVKLVSNRPLFRRFHHIPGVPPGELVSFDGSKTIDCAGYSQLNNGCDVIYITAAEVKELGIH